MKIPSDIVSLRRTRQRLAQWARTTGLSSAAVNDLVLACYEALVNCIEHAYRGRMGDVLLSTKRTNDHVTVTVTDYGRWRGLRTPGARGRGLLLMQELADDVHIAIDKDHPGTTVHLHWRLDKSTQITTDQPT